MLKRKYRLLKKAEFGKHLLFKTPYFVLKTAKNNLSYSRFSFIVSKRVSSKAVERNRVKRQIRSCVEKNLNIIEKGTDMVFLINRQALGKTTEDLCSFTLELLKKEKLIKA